MNENGSGRKALVEIYNFTEVESHYIETSTFQTDPTLTISLSIVAVVVLALLGASGLVLATIVIKRRMVCIHTYIVVHKICMYSIYICITRGVIACMQQVTVLWY